MLKDKYMKNLVTRLAESEEEGEQERVKKELIHRIDEVNKLLYHLKSISDEDSEIWNTAGEIINKIKP